MFVAQRWQRIRQLDFFGLSSNKRKRHKGNLLPFLSIHFPKSVSIALQIEDGIWIQTPKGRDVPGKPGVCAYHYSRCCLRSHTATQMQVSPSR